MCRCRQLHTLLNSLIFCKFVTRWYKEKLYGSTFSNTVNIVHFYSPKDGKLRYFSTYFILEKVYTLLQFGTLLNVFMSVLYCAQKKVYKPLLKFYDTLDETLVLKITLPQAVQANRFLFFQSIPSVCHLNDNRGKQSREMSNLNERVSWQKKSIQNSV